MRHQLPMPELRNRHETCRGHQIYALPSPLNPNVPISSRVLRSWALDVSDSKAILKTVALMNEEGTYDTSQLHGFSKVYLGCFLQFRGHHL